MNKISLKVYRAIYWGVHAAYMIPLFCYVSYEFFTMPGDDIWGKSFPVFFAVYATCIFLPFLWQYVLYNALKNLIYSEEKTVPRIIWNILLSVISAVLLIYQLVVYVAILLF
jgi:hypothetical protein